MGGRSIFRGVGFVGGAGAGSLLIARQTFERSRDICLHLKSLRMT
jgi:hypothetical protein